MKYFLLGLFLGYSALFAQPVIHAFQISSTSIDIGSPVIISWDVSNSETVWIDQDIGFVESQGSIEIIPLRDTVYTLTAQSFQGKVQQQVQVDVNFDAPPYISSFYAVPDFISPSDVTELSWQTINATTVRLIPDVGALPLSGSKIVSPSITTRYELVASNGYGTTSAFFEVTVSMGRLPELNILKVSPNPVHAGSSFSIEWSIKNGELVSFYRGDQLRFQNRFPTGKTTEKAELGALYWLYAENEYGSQKWQIPVEILPRDLDIIEFKATPPAVFPGERTLVSWELRNAEQVTLSQFGAVNSKGSSLITLGVTTTLILKAEVDGQSHQFRLTIPVLNSEPHHGLYFPYFPGEIDGRRLVSLVNVSEDPVEVLLNTFTGDQKVSEKITHITPHSHHIEEVDITLTNPWVQVLFREEDQNVNGLEGHAIIVPKAGDILAYEACKNQASPMLVPHIAKWPQFSTRANVINLSYKDQNFEFVQNEKAQMGTVGSLETFSQELGVLNHPSGWGYIQPDQGYSAMVGVQTFGSESDPQLAALSLGNSTPAHQVLYFPHIADRGNFWTGMVVINPSDREVRLDFEIYDLAGERQPGLPRIVLPPFKKQLFLVDKIRNDFGTRADWVRVKASEEVAGYMIFGNNSGQQVQCGLPTGFEPCRSLVFTHAYANGFLGIAILNPNPSTNLVQLRLRGPDGLTLGEQTLEFVANQKKVFLAHEIFPGLKAGDTIWAEADQPISGFQLIGEGDQKLGGLMAIQNRHSQDFE